MNGICDLTYGDNIYHLNKGWNLVGWLGYHERVGDNPPVAEGLASIDDNLVMVWGFDDGEWAYYNPGLPAGMNTLETLRVGRGYWVNVNGICDLTYEGHIYQLQEGWNLIGWLG